MILYLALFIWVCVIPGVIALWLSLSPRHPREFEVVNDTPPTAMDMPDPNGLDGFERALLRMPLTRSRDVTFPGD